MVPVIPFNVQGVIPHGAQQHGLDSFGGSGGQNLKGIPRLGALLTAGGTGTGLAYRGECIMALMAIIPHNTQRAMVIALHFYRVRGFLWSRHMRLEYRSIIEA
jgi:hypothetical protein